MSELANSPITVASSRRVGGYLYRQSGPFLPLPFLHTRTAHYHAHYEELFPPEESETLPNVLSRPLAQPLKIDVINLRPRARSIQRPLSPPFVIARELGDKRGEEVE